MHYLYLSPLIVFAVPPEALLGQPGPVALVVALTGSTGMLLHQRKLALLGSMTLLGLLIWGKVAADLLKSSPQDTAVLLAEFIAILFFMEACMVILTFDSTRKGLEERDDEISRAQQARLLKWATGQVSRQGKLALATILLSVTLLPLAGATSISSNQLAVSGSLALVAITMLLFLVTYRREPEGK